MQEIPAFSLRWENCTLPDGTFIRPYSTTHCLLIVRVLQPICWMYAVCNVTHRSSVYRCIVLLRYMSHQASKRPFDSHQHNNSRFMSTADKEIYDLSIPLIKSLQIHIIFLLLYDYL